MAEKIDWNDPALGAKLYEKQITQLKADLAEFGGHTADCAVTELLMAGGDAAIECDCGWKAFLDKHRSKA